MVGEDDTDPIATVTTLLFEYGLDIDGLGQAVSERIFRMTMQVDTLEMDCSREQRREDPATLGDDLDVDVAVRFPSDRETGQITVMVTKESLCLEAIFEAWPSGDLAADVSVVLGNHPDVEPLAERYEVPFTTRATRTGRPTWTNSSACSRTTSTWSSRRATCGPFRPRWAPATRTGLSTSTRRCCPPSRSRRPPTGGRSYQRRR